MIRKKCKKNSQKCVSHTHSFFSLVRSYHTSNTNSIFLSFFKILSYTFFYFSHSHRHRKSLFTLFSLSPCYYLIASEEKAMTLVNYSIKWRKNVNKLIYEGVSREEFCGNWDLLFYGERFTSTECISSFFFHNVYLNLGNFLIKFRKLKIVSPHPLSITYLIPKKIYNYEKNYTKKFESFHFQHHILE